MTNEMEIYYSLLREQGLKDKEIATVPNVILFGQKILNFNSSRRVIV